MNSKEYSEDRNSRYGELFEESIRTLLTTNSNLKEFVSEFYSQRSFVVSRLHSILDDDYFTYICKKSFNDLIDEPRRIKIIGGFVQITASYKQNHKCYNFIIEGEKIIVKNSLWNLKIKNFFYSFDVESAYLIITDKEFREYGYSLNNKEGNGEILYNEKTNKFIFSDNDITEKDNIQKFFIILKNKLGTEINTCAEISEANKTNVDGEKQTIRKEKNSYSAINSNDSNKKSFNLNYFISPINVALLRSLSNDKTCFFFFVSVFIFLTIL